MKGFIRLIILSAMIANLTSCTSQPVEGDVGLDDMDSSSEVVADDTTSGGDDFADLEEPVSEKTEKSGAVADNSDLSLEESPAESQPVEQTANTAEGSLDQEFADAEGEQKPAQAAAGGDELSLEETPTPKPVVTQEPVVQQPEITPAPEPLPDIPAPVATEQLPPQPEAPSEMMAKITDLKFTANDAGGTVIVEADKPVRFTTRSNSDLNQFIVEVENATLPDKLKRSLNTRDIKGSFGAIDAYQNPGSTTARFVIQLRPGVVEPTVQSEGNSLLIVANASPSPAIATASSSEETSAVLSEDTESKILPGQNLTEFMAGNTKFYGKKISIETSNIDVREALNLITEESGVNMVISEDVKGPLSLKLRQVPWDQALVVIMQAKKLGYSRQGNVLRIAPLQELKAEEDDSTKLAAARKNLEPLKVRMFPVSYAKVEDLERKVKDFLGERGRVVGDTRTNSLVVTDIQENLDRAARLIASLDTQPPQVLIESKIVEALESFTRNIGVQWNVGGGDGVKLGSSPRGPVTMKPSLTSNPSLMPNKAFMGLGLNVGVLDVFGTLNASLALSESEQQVKVISSPRIMTLSNEKADINQTTELPVKNSTVVANAVTESFSFKALTLKLEVTPQVTADGSVIMKVGVNRQFKGADVSSAQGSTAFGVNSREANTKVLVKNGQTAVIGGIYQSDADTSETGVPYFREIPVLGALFKTKNTSKQKSELLVFLTPRIIGPVTTESESSTPQNF